MLKLKGIQWNVWNKWEKKEKLMTIKSFIAYLNMYIDLKKSDYV